MSGEGSRELMEEPEEATAVAAGDSHAAVHAVDEQGDDLVGPQNRLPLLLRRRLLHLPPCWYRHAEQEEQDQEVERGAVNHCAMWRHQPPR